MEKNGLICFILLWIVSVCNAALSCDMQIPHGDVTWWCVKPPYSYSCHEGYKEHDAVSWLDCSTSGQWVPWLWNRPVSAKDLCTPKPCPTVISKGAFSGTCPAVVGSTCSFSCEAGYMRNASVSELTCQNSTEWSADLTSLCLRPDGQQCPYYIPRGYLNLTCIREPGQTCNFMCDEGYHSSISPSTIACGSNLAWNYNPKSLCPETICPKYFEGGYVSEFCSRKYKATCYDFQCNPGYNKLAFSVKCDESGKWINPYDISPACVNMYNMSSSLTFRTTPPSARTSTSLFPSLWPDGQQCPYYIPRGYLNLTCIREPGQTCNFMCDEGYHSSISPSTIACGSNLEWNYNPKSLCQETICPKYFEGGYVSEFCSRKYKATCYDFQCNPGYIKLAFTVKCDESGKWINPYDISPACVNMYNMSSSLTFRTTPPAARTTTSLFPTLWPSKSYFNDVNDGKSGNGNLGTIVGTTVGALTGILIIFLFIGWIVKRSSARKSQRRERGGLGSGCLRPRENPLQDITTIQQQPNTNGMGNVSSFESPSYNGIYVHPFLQRISTISSSCNYPDPPPSYSKTPIAPNEDPPTYEEVVSNHSRFNLYN